MTPEPLIAGEITPQPNQTQAAGLILQQRGFQVLHLGHTISIQGPKSLWESTFNIQFIPHHKPSFPEIPESKMTVYQADMADAALPLDLQPLIQNVSISEPPELLEGT